MCLILTVFYKFIICYFVFEPNVSPSEYIKRVFKINKRNLSINCFIVSKYDVIIIGSINHIKRVYYIDSKIVICSK